jgi:hypothetical protein
LAGAVVWAFAAAAPNIDPKANITPSQRQAAQWVPDVPSMSHPWDRS